MPRFAILRHDCPRGLHWDLLLENGQTLRTWALAQEPLPGILVACEALPDHRLDYLDYEGPVSAGRGTVGRWDQGIYHVQGETDVELTIQLCGTRLAGRAVLRREPEEPLRWQFLLAY